MATGSAGEILVAEGKTTESAYNRKAKHDYFREDFYECGLVLTGTEIKSIREGHVQFKDAYVSIFRGEA